MKKTVLLCDDDKKDLASYKLVLESTGKFTVITEAFGLRCVEAAIRHLPAVPDIIVLDIFFQHTDGADGEKVFESIRANPELARVPVIILTGNMDRALCVAAEEPERLKFYKVKEEPPGYTLEEKIDTVLSLNRPLK